MTGKTFLPVTGAALVKAACAADGPSHSMILEADDFRHHVDTLNGMAKKGAGMYCILQPYSHEEEE